MSRHGMYAEGTVRPQIAMPEALWIAIKEAAKAEGMNASEYLRTVMRRTTTRRLPRSWKTESQS